MEPQGSCRKYSRIPIFRTSTGNGNFFEKSGVELQRETRVRPRDRDSTVMLSLTTELNK